MTDAMRTEIDFFLYDWLQVETLQESPVFADQDRTDWDAYLDLSGAISEKEFLSCYKAADRDEPQLIDGRVRVQPDMKRALQTYLDAGLHLATVEHQHGGMGFPFVIATGAMAEAMAANVAAVGLPMLSIANARVITEFGTPEQIAAFARPQFDGEALGTMCLSEPDIGSSLGDITTKATPDGEDALGARYLLSGRKMWISAGDQDVTDNVVHLVLAKAVQPDGSTLPGPKGTSLFIVPRVMPDGTVNDVAVAGLNHKMGYRGTPNCLLNFGEQDGAVGWRIGAEGDGLKIMFQMMNEARINVGLGGAAQAYRGFELARRYAGERVQGRPAHEKTRPKPVTIRSHPDIRRLLMQQKALSEGALALCLKAAHLSDIARAAPDARDRGEAAALLDLLTPVIKSWPSEQGLVSLHQSIQVHGGYGYTRDFDVEQLYRDSRLNPIHEGTTGIQAIDLVGRKILGDRGQSATQFLNRVRQDARQGSGFDDEAARLLTLCDEMDQTVTAMLADGAQADALSNATPFLEGFGHFVLAWIWLDLARAAARGNDPHMAEAKGWACRYFFAFEVPRIAGMLAPLRSAPTLTREVPDHVLG